jgi:hypothetical protein
MGGEPRDVRTSPESPALRSDEPSKLVLSLLSPINPPLILSRRERAFTARSTHLFESRSRVVNFAASVLVTLDS